MRTTRREFMAHSTAALAGAAVAPLAWTQHAAADDAPVPGAKPTLVVLYLRGGADALNTVVPFGDPLYYKIRPTIAIPPRATATGPGVIPLTRGFGLHPAMPELASLYQTGRVAFVLNAGSTHPTRSHFDAQDFMERAAPGVKHVTEGWLNRYLTATKTADDSDLRAVSLQATLPRSLRGEYPVLAVPDYGADRAMRVFESLYGCPSEKEATRASVGDLAKPPAADDVVDRIVEAGATGITKLRRLNEILRVERPGGEGYPDSHLGRQFRDLAKLVHAEVGLEVAAIDYNGWDHHAYQGAAHGTMGTMLREVSRAVGAFAQDLGPRMQNTVVLVMSEFGRTVRENGNNGSDHGHGGLMMLVGGPVRGGRLYGGWRGLERRALYEGRDLPVTVDFRDVFAETLHGLFGFRAADQRFFPDYRGGKPLGLIRPA